MVKGTGAKIYSKMVPGRAHRGGRLTISGGCTQRETWIKVDPFSLPAAAMPGSPQFLFGFTHLTLNPNRSNDVLSWISIPLSSPGAIESAVSMLPSAHKYAA